MRKGCLFDPGISTTRWSGRRAREGEVSSTSKGASHEIEANGLLPTCLQHENRPTSTACPVYSTTFSKLKRDRGVLKKFTQGGQAARWSSVSYRRAFGLLS